MPTTATPLSRTRSAVARRVIPPVSISGRGLVCTRSFARSRKQASRELDTSTLAVVAAQVESAVHALFDASPAMSRAAAAPAGDQGVSGGS
ncbi:hypothetical protein ACWF2L_04240 [Streptomyces anulatus]